MRVGENWCAMDIGLDSLIGRENVFLARDVHE